MSGVSNDKKQLERYKKENKRLKQRLRESEETLRAIQQGEVDAFVVEGPQGDQIFTLKGAELPYRIFIEQMVEGAVTLSSEGLILYCNRKFAEMAGRPMEEIIGTSIYGLVSPHDKEKIVTLLEDKTGKDELELCGPGGEKVPVNFSMTVLQSFGIHYYCAVATDLTEQKFNESEKVKLIAEQAARAAAEKSEGRLRMLAAALAKSNQELEQFAYIASHDLQEPLRTIANYVDLLFLRKKEQMDADEIRYFNFIQESAFQAQELIKGLLGYASLTGNHTLESHEIQKLLGQAVANLKTSIDETGAEIKAGDLPNLKVHGLQVVQLFQNLISNAIKYRGKEPPRIQIGVQHEEKRWVFSVRDNGIGIAPEHQERVFLIFKRLHSNKDYPGTGIGLALCKKIVEQHGGNIWLESKPEQGATFYFSLPNGEHK